MNYFAGSVIALTLATGCGNPDEGAFGEQDGVSQLTLELGTGRLVVPSDSNSDKTVAVSKVVVAIDAIEIRSDAKGWVTVRDAPFSLDLLV